MEEINYVPSYFVSCVLFLNSNMVLILFLLIIIEVVFVHMDFEIHFCWVFFLKFVVVSIIDLEYLENNMLKNNFF